MKEGVGAGVGSMAFPIVIVNRYAGLFQRVGDAKVGRSAELERGAVTVARWPVKGNL